MTADPAKGGSANPTHSTGTGMAATTEFVAAPLRPHIEAHPTGKRLVILSFTALGVVYGDIGTSPLYAIKECFKPLYGLTVTSNNVYGVLSLIIWCLLLIVTVKYVGFILRADNRGEGGVFAMLALILQKPPGKGLAARTALIMPGLLGGAFLYGDGIITPAISVLGAVEGLQVAASNLRQLAMVVFAAFIIAALLNFQDHGPAKLGGTFGCSLLVWLSAIAIVGPLGITKYLYLLYSLSATNAFA